MERSAIRAWEAYTSWAKTKDLLIDEVVEGSIDPVEASTKWRELFAPCQELVDQIKNDSAVELPAHEIHLGVITKSFTMAKTGNNELRQYCQQVDGIDGDGRFKTSALVDFAHECHSTDIAPAIAVLVTALRNELDEIRGTVMFDDVEN